MLQQKAINESYEDYLKDATHIFAYNKDVYQHNMQRLESIQTSKFTFTAEDSKKDGETVLVETTNLKEMAGGLAKTISIAVGAKVMLTKKCSGWTSKLCIWGCYWVLSTSSRRSRQGYIQAKIYLCEI